MGNFHDILISLKKSTKKDQNYSHFHSHIYLLPISIENVGLKISRAITSHLILCFLYFDDRYNITDHFGITGHNRSENEHN
jgi:hypothetical protein